MTRDLLTQEGAGESITPIAVGGSRDESPLRFSNFPSVFTGVENIGVEGDVQFGEDTINFVLGRGGIGEGPCNSSPSVALASQVGRVEPCVAKAKKVVPSFREETTYRSLTTNDDSGDDDYEPIGHRNVKCKSSRGRKKAPKKRPPRVCKKSRMGETSKKVRGKRRREEDSARDDILDIDEYADEEEDEMQGSGPFYIFFFFILLFFLC